MRSTANRWRFPQPICSAPRAGLSTEFRAAVATAAANIRAFAEMQLPAESLRETQSRVGTWVRWCGRSKPSAAYIPAGRYPLPSTLMMTVIPAQVAGVPNICVACPQPVPRSWVRRTCWAYERVFQMGGAQAIAAFAYGTRTVPRADRIVGPGNIYVAAAKKLLAGDVGIDFVAGPTEILIISADGNPRHLAADMLAQAEHDVDAAAILLTTSQAAGQCGGEGDRAAACGSANRRRSRAKRSSATAPSLWCARSKRPSSFRIASRPST